MMTLKFIKNLRTLSLNFCTICFAILISYEVSLGQEDIYQKVAKETCACISKSNIADQTKQQIEAALGLCMLESINNNKIDVEITNSEAMREFGQKVGIQMAPICPSVFKAFVNDNNGESSNKDNEKAVTALNGKVKAVEVDGFLYLTLKEDAGNEQRLIWLSNFDGSDSFVTDPKKLIGKSVSLKYRSVEYYLPKAKGYLSLKEIVELKIKE
jgi:hypothetical protein